MLLAVAACFLTVVWLTQIAGDPTDGVVFFSFAFAAAVLLGSGLVIAAARRREIFGGLGLGGAIVILVSSLMASTLGFAGGVIGLSLMVAAVARRKPRLLPGLVLLGIGVLGMAVRLDASNDAYTVFLPLIAVGSAVLAVTLQRL